MTKLTAEKIGKYIKALNAAEPLSFEPMPIFLTPKAIKRYEADGGLAKWFPGRKVYEIGRVGEEPKLVYDPLSND